MKTYLSLGAGVDTTAILLMPDVMDKTDFVMFADTGGENAIKKNPIAITNSTKL